MNVSVEPEEVWVTSVEDRTGGVAEKLSLLAEAGADLDFIIARRAPERPGTGVLFVTPLRGDREIEAATELGFSATSRLHSLRIEGRSVPGIGARLTRAISQAGINLRGVSGAVIGTQFVLHVSFDTAEDSTRAADLLRKQVL